MTLETFWNVTLREVFMVIQAEGWRRTERERHEMRVAWHTARLAGAAFSQAGMEPLSRLVPPTYAEELAERDAPPMTVADEVSYWQALAIQHRPRALPPPSPSKTTTSSKRRAA